MAQKVHVYVGTSKGAFVFESDPARKKWTSSDILFKSWIVMHVNLDPRDQRLHAATAHFVYGPTTHYSDDFGKTWIQAREVPTLPRPSKSGRPASTVEEMFRAESGETITDTPEKMIKVWNITPGRPDEPGVLYAGTQPAALFVSTDRGESWSLNESLYDHPHRGQFNPGAGGFCLHTIVLDPSNLKRMYIAISAGGTYRTDDGGATWNPRNKGVRAEYNPDPYPEFGQCVHKIAMHPSTPNVLYQQSHDGMYRSDDSGDSWLDVGTGKLPSRWGFPVVVHPADPHTVYLIPAESQEYHMSIDGQFTVWRTRNAGETWEPLRKGLPEKARLNVLREAMATDGFADAGIYAGTNTGQLFYSRDSGDNWELLADYLPPIYSVEASVIDA